MKTRFDEHVEPVDGESQGNDPQQNRTIRLPSEYVQGLR